LGAAVPGAGRIGHVAAPALREEAVPGVLPRLLAEAEGEVVEDGRGLRHALDAAEIADRAEVPLLAHQRLEVVDRREVVAGLEHQRRSLGLGRDLAPAIGRPPPRGVALRRGPALA